MNTLPTLNRQGRTLIDNAMSGLGFARHPMVSRAGNRFALIDGAGNSRPLALMDQAGRIYMDVIIFDASQHPNRMFFAGEYSRDNSDPPDCFSDNGIGPSKQARNPQSATCAVCPNAVWGSKISPTGAKIPACQIGKKVAVLVIGDDSGLAYEFRVPPGSFSGQPEHDPQEGGWTWYLKTLKGYGKELFDVVTRITFVPNTMGVLVFKPIAVTEGNAELVDRINRAWESKAGEELVGAKDQPIDPMLVNQQQVLQVDQRPLPPPPQQMSSAGQTQPHAQIGQQYASQQYGQLNNPGALSGPSPIQEAPKRTRRTKAQIEADNAVKAQQVPTNQANPFAPQDTFVSGLQQAPQGAPVADPDIPPFLRRAAPAAPANPQNGQFGTVASPPAPNPDIQAALKAAFSLPVGK